MIGSFECAPQQPQAGGAFATLEWPGDVRELPRTGSMLPYGIAVGAVLLLLVATFVARRRRRRRMGQPSSAAAGATPGPTALVQLRALHLPVDAAGGEAFCTAVKAVLRLHAHELFGVRAFSATSEELRQRVPPHDALDGALRACDQVLFGRGRADAETGRRILAAAEAWLVASTGAGA